MTKRYCFTTSCNTFGPITATSEAQAIRIFCGFMGFRRLPSDCQVRETK